ncbi:hypothetical protein KKC44_03060 [Patescibacteria group bacterium]|nr:hypothetical protein [Patescibacteria group bacterium]MBU2259565.1 hypothetical protein [Patescibacteria group bacterium]
MSFKKNTPETFVSERADQQDESIEKRTELDQEVKDSIAQKLETLKGEIEQDKKPPVSQKPPDSIEEFSEKYLAQTGYYNEVEDTPKRVEIINWMGIDSTRHYDSEALREGEDSVQSGEQQVV